MTSPLVRPRLYAVTMVTLVLALVATMMVRPAGAQDSVRVGDVEDPVLAAIAINQAKTQGSGNSALAVVGRSDVFADNLAATALAGTTGVLLLTDGGPNAELRPEVAAELDRTLAPGACEQGQGPTVYLAGGDQAISQAVEQQLGGSRFCIRRLEGPSRVETAIAVADAVPDPSGTVLLARSDDFADAGAVGAFAARTHSRILVTSPTQLQQPVAAALERMNPDQIVLLGGEEALSPAVEQAAQEFGTLRRVQGAARDATAVAIAEELWADQAGDGIALADGYGPQDWTYLFAGAAIAGQQSLPILYSDLDQPTPATRNYLDANPVSVILAIGPAVAPPPTADLDNAAVALQQVAGLDAPLMLQPRPGTAELWVAERAGRIQALGPAGQRQVLDISDTVSTNGERGLLGLAFNPDGTQLFTSTTDTAGDSVIDQFQIIGNEVDVASRRELLQVDQPASNHNGGDLQWGPDGYLWWSLGDGGGGGDTYHNGQNTGTLLGTLVRIDPDGGDPYAIPPGNPFAGGGGAPELWSYGLRNPFRFTFDPLNGDLYIADVGQGEVEEIDFVPAGTGAGSNFGWPIFEGNQPFDGGGLNNHFPPVFEEFHDDGNCSITGGVVYRGSAIPELYGAYLYTDLCRNSVRAIVVEDGQVTQATDLVVRTASPVGFGVDHAGEAYVLSLDGPVSKIVPG
ncbi:MAG: PQQ-dependent sugar dehydrogenase [Euzebya sp.]